jgi:hypothetical protein
LANQEATPSFPLAASWLSLSSILYKQYLLEVIVSPAIELLRMVQGSIGMRKACIGVRNIGFPAQEPFQVFYALSLCDSILNAYPAQVRDGGSVVLILGASSPQRHLNGIVQGDAAVNCEQSDCRIGA